MDSFTLSFPANQTAPLKSFDNRHFLPSPSAHAVQLVHSRLNFDPHSYGILRTSYPFASAPCTPLIRRRFKPVRSSGDEEIGVGGGGGGGAGGEAGNEELPSLSSDVITLHVKGMMCEGCESSVKRILESLPQVLSASANHKTETATVWPAFEVKVTPNWQIKIGETLAEQLTSRGFESKLQGQEASE